MSIIALSHSCQTFGWTFYRGFFQTMLGVKSDSEASATSVCVFIENTVFIAMTAEPQNAHRTLQWSEDTAGGNHNSAVRTADPIPSIRNQWWVPTSVGNELPNSFCGTLPTWHLLTQGERVAAGAQIPTASDAGMVDGGVQGSWGRQPFGQSYVGIGCI